MSSILVIEDEDAVRENILELLSQEGYEVVGTPDGEAGIRRVSDVPPDLIICDILMPGIDGYGVLTKISQNPRLNHIPFLFLTARVNREDMRRGMDLGADDYITKPYTRAELLKAVEIRLGKQKKRVILAQEKLNDLRSQITSSLPKDLIAPLSILLRSTDHLDDQVDILVAAEVRRVAKDIHRTAQNLFQLVQNHLLSADLELAANDPNRLKDFEPVDGMEGDLVVQEIAREVARQGDRENDLSIHMEPGKIRIYEEYFSKIIEELTRFSFQRSLKGSPIQIFGKRRAEKQSYDFKVVDFGPVLTAEQLAVLSSARSYSRKEYEALGIEIGMILVKQLVNIFHGSLQVTTRSDLGTQFDLSFPMAPDPTPRHHHYWI